MPRGWFSFRHLGHVLRASCRPMWSAVPAAFGMPALAPCTGLVQCTRCRADMVWPIDWDEIDDERWSMRLRCGQCGFARTAIATNAEADEFDHALDRQCVAIERTLAQVERERLALETDRFAEALRRDLIDVTDFERGPFSDD